ncbi:MAG TPA: alpha/beta hydrolase fold domain-containing protein [Bryobacteraceae bacterium]|nr:alpha/beta hydrolase fold domain-containing protein [Bryobacteraceae bacterium]
MQPTRRAGILLYILSAVLPAQPKAPPMPANVIYEPDLDYAPAVGGKLQLDIVRPRDSSGGSHPAVLCIHGGGFRAGARQSYLPLCIKLAQRGYVAATVTYRLAPKFQFPAPVHDVKAAVRFLRANAEKYSIDPDRIGVTGGSAGGHLALFLGLTPGVAEFEGYGPHLEQSSRVSAVVDYYGPTDFTKSYGKSVDAPEVLPQFIGGDLEHARAAHLKASPLNWVSPSSAPVLAIHGTKDRYVAYEQSQWLVDRLHAAGVEATLETMEGSDHGFKGDYLERAEKLLFAFFDKHLAAPREERKILVSNHGAAGEVMALSWPSGKVLWRVPNQHGHDVQGLPGGHVLYTIGPARKVVEMDQERRSVWEYGEAEGLQHPLAAQRLPNGNTLIGDARLGKVVEVTPAKKVVWQYENPDMANMRMRSCRATGAGTTLISIEAAGKIIEVDRAGKIIWTFQTDPKRTPYQAHRLKNGNTLVGMANPGEVVEVGQDGKVVRSIAGARDDLKLAWASGTQQLPGGGLLISDYTGKRLIEVDASGKLVHELPVGAWGIASISLVR